MSDDPEKKEDKATPVSESSVDGKDSSSSEAAEEAAVVPEPPIKKLLDSILGDQFSWHQTEAGDNSISIPAEKWHEVSLTLRDHEELDFKFLRSLTGTDYPEENCIELTGHLLSYTHKHTLVIKTKADKSQPKLDTISDVWHSANWYERECFDLLGVEFNNHPDMRRILMPDDWEGHPLLKDYKENSSYRGIPTARPGYEKDGGAQ